MKTKKVSIIIIIILLTSGLFVTSCKAPKKSSQTKSSSSTKTSNSQASKNSQKKESNKAIENKYAEILVVPDKVISNNLSLYLFVDEWNGVPYKYGGKTKQGVDCSSLSTILYREVYNKSVIGSSADLFTFCNPIKKEDLKEGDFVFFKIGQSKISHMGVYLQNNKFVHATTKKGVMINDLDEAYYKKYFYKAGRLK